MIDFDSASDFASNPVEAFAVVIDADATRFIGPLNDVDAFALLGCCAEDPATWESMHLADDGIPGDTGGHLGTAFLVAELVGALKQEGADQSDIDLLNDVFRTYRTAESLRALESAADAFKQTLNELSDRHEFLVSRSADLQSRIDEQLRAPAFNDDGDDDVPF